MFSNKNRCGCWQKKTHCAPANFTWKKMRLWCVYNRLSRLKTWRGSKKNFMHFRRFLLPKPPVLDPWWAPQHKQILPAWPPQRESSNWRRSKEMPGLEERDPFAERRRSNVRPKAMTKRRSLRPWRDLDLTKSLVSTLLTSSRTTDLYSSSRTPECKLLPMPTRMYKAFRRFCYSRSCCAWRITKILWHD